jgi:ribosomal protein S27AE
MTDTLNKVKAALALTTAAGTLLRTAAQTIGPPLLRFVSGGKEGEAFSGMKLAGESSSSAPLTIDAVRNGARIDKVCGRCGSRDVLVHAQVKWSARNQEWECVELYDEDMSCPRCGSAPYLRDVEARAGS